VSPGLEKDKQDARGWYPLNITWSNITWNRRSIWNKTTKKKSLRNVHLSFQSLAGRLSTLYMLSPISLKPHENDDSHDDAEINLIRERRNNASKAIVFA